MVAGHYQPLADGDAIELPTPCVARPNLSSAVESEDKDKQSQVGPGLRFSSAPCGIACLRPLQPKRSGRLPGPDYVRATSYRLATPLAQAPRRAVRALASLHLHLRASV